MGQAPGIFINYQVQYQFPRQQLGQQAQQLPQPLHPIPTFPGFPGPGGVWQPWPVAEVPVDLVQAEAPAQRALNPSPTPTVPHELQNTPSTPSSSSSPSDIPQSDTPTSSKEDGSLREPRDAAALAALNRLRGKRSPESAEPVGGSSQTGSTHTRSTSSANSPQLESNPSVTTGQAAPHLIPLYDYRSSFSPLVMPLQREAAPLQAIRASNRYSAPRRVQDFSSHSPAGPVQPQQQRSSVLPQLPPNLTDEQLANLDRLTRESIDERLRILEGVSGAVYRCIDDLMRLRSAIPPTTMDAVPPETVHLPFSSAAKSEPSPTSETEIRHPTRHGKEKMQESLDIESTAVASTSTKDSPSSQSPETDV
jgi:E3 ubiquitin-protein ligase synoviolin